MTQQRQPQLFTSATEDHYTPRDIIERARYVFDGAIDLDPASSEAANAVIKAKRYYADPYSQPDQVNCAGFDGLQLSWRASSLWLNPPFSVPARDAHGLTIYNAQGKVKRERVIAQWVARWVQATKINFSLAAGALQAEADQAMLLIPARTDTEWFAPLWHYHMCFITGRLHFNEADNGATFPSVIVYSGPYLTRFYHIFDDIGTCGKLTPPY